jgi:hypothetical protein
MASAPESDGPPSPDHFRRHSGLFWRVVESQNVISSDRLVDDPDDQPILEALIEQVKPPIPEEASHLPRLLATPFRYWHESGSRFRRPNAKPGIFYASERESTSVAEKAFYRLKFLSRSAGIKIPETVTEHMAFKVQADAARALDLTAPPFDRRRAEWTNPDDYRACQDFASEARRIDTQLIRYESARDPGQSNDAILDPAVLDGNSLEIIRSWHFRYERGRLSAYAAFPSPQRLTFTFEQFGFAPAA